MKKLLFALSLLMIFVWACKKDSVGNSSFTSDCSGAAKSYASDIAPIIQTYCNSGSGCHAAGGREIPLATYSQVYNNRSAIRASVISGSMPQNSSLTNAQKNTTVCWIDNGASNN